MTSAAAALALILLGVAGSANASDDEPSDRDILVTFENDGERAVSGGFGAPFRHRLRYSISAEAERDAAAIEHEYALIELDRWPIRSLAVVCIVYRLSENQDRDDILARLNADSRIESAQPFNRFETAAGPIDGYNDKYAALQYGLAAMGIIAAHKYSRGANVRVAVVDGPADINHEDLQGRIARTEIFADIDDEEIAAHGTAIASLIAANANNAKGIVGVAPDAQIEMFVACWAQARSEQAVCNSFTLAKALDALLADPPDIVNLSLVGPYDPLLERLLRRAHDAGVILIAASAEGGSAGDDFPASMETVIGIASANQRPHVLPANIQPSPSRHPRDIFSLGNQIMVALPNDEYDFRSGSSLAAAQITGVVALLLAVSPQISSETVRGLLFDSQRTATSGSPVVNACTVLHLADRSRVCR
jgi:subtilisin family serine protease